MKRAFDCYFQKLKTVYDEQFSTLPTVAYSDQLNKSLLVSGPDEDGEVQWEPQEQTSPIQWETIEENLGFSVCEELKTYYSTYLFLMLSGKLGNILLNFYPVGATEPVQKTINRSFQDAQYFFPNTQIFILGNAKVADNDNYFICYDNSGNKLFCYESDKQEQIPLCDSLSQTIKEMEACL